MGKPIPLDGGAEQGKRPASFPSASSSGPAQPVPPPSEHKFCVMQNQQLAERRIFASFQYVQDFSKWLQRVFLLPKK